MRTIVDLTAEQMESLRTVCEEDGISRAEAVRRAIDTQTAAREKDRKTALLAEGFGSWGPSDVDSRVLIDELRAEWDDRKRRLGPQRSL